MKLSRTILMMSVAFFIAAAPAVVAAHWSSYGPAFTRAVGWTAQKASPSQQIVVMGTTIFTPRAEVKVAIACDGFEGIRTFSALFGLILLLNYRRMATWRFCALYFLAVSLLWIHNAARVIVAVIRGRETHFHTSEIMVLTLACGSAVAAVRSARPSRHRDPPVRV